MSDTHTLSGNGRWAILSYGIYFFIASAKIDILKIPYDERVGFKRLKIEYSWNISSIS